MGKDGEFLDFEFFSNEEFGRFAILPNIHNQKYTLGSKFLGREAQGEFISCSCREILPGGNNSYCEILCENGTFWVTPLNDSPIFINDQPIKGKTELKFSTYLTLGEESEENNYKLLENGRPVRYNSLDLFFCERTFNIPIGPLNLNLCPPIDFIPGRNNLILSNVLSFLPHSDLKAVREVSNSWNNEAARLLKKNSVVKFNPENRATCFLRYENEMKDMKISRWELNVADFQYSSKLLEDLDWFLKSQDALQELKLSMQVTFLDSPNFVNLILAKLAKSLKELELDSDYFDIFNQNHGLSFPNLKSLKFSDVCFDKKADPQAEEVKLNLLSYFIKFSPSLTEIMTEKLYHSNSEPLLGELFRLSENKINSISIRLCNAIILAPLLGFQNPLKKLWLEDLDEFRTKDFRILDQILEKNSQSLISLKLGFRGYGGRGGIKPIRLPKFPKLHYLNIGIKFVTWRRDYDFIFPGGSMVNYDEYFPKLQHLVLAAAPSSTCTENENVLFPFLHDGAAEIKHVEITCDPRFMRNAKKLSERLVK